MDPQKLNLTCVDKKLIGMIGSLYFLGFAISAGVVSRLADKFGRKTPFFLSVLLLLISQIGIFYSTSIRVTIVLYLLVGLSAGGRVCISIQYLNEFTPTKY